MVWFKIRVLVARIKDRDGQTFCEKYPVSANKHKNGLSRQTVLVCLRTITSG